MSKNAMTALDVTICGLSELGLFRDAGLTHAVSILDAGFSRPVALDFCPMDNQLHLRFDDVIDDGPTPGGGPPEPAHIAEILAFGRSLPNDPPVRLLIHCFGGISRSTATAILLLAQRDPGRDPGEIIAEVVRRRPQAWPNLRIIELGDELLGRQGSLVAAVHRRYRVAAATNPEFLEELRAEGRFRELDLLRGVTSDFE